MKTLTPALKDTVAKAYAASIGALGNAEAEAYASRVAQSVMASGASGMDIITK